MVARVLICLVRAFQLFEVAVAAAVFRTGSGLCKRDFSAPHLPAKPPLGHVQRSVAACEQYHRYHNMNIGRVNCSSVTVEYRKLTDQADVIKWLRKVRKCEIWTRKSVTLKSGA